MNINTAQNDHITRQYWKTLHENGLQQHVKAFTRLTSKSNTTIDHTISNILNIETLVCHHRISDHQAVLTCFNKPKKNKREQSKIQLTNETNNITKIHYKQSAEAIEKINWKEWMTNNKNKNTHQLYDSLDKTIQSCIKRVKKGTKKEKVEMPYITKTVINLRQNTEKARKKFIKKRTENNEKNYKLLNKEYTYALRKAKNDYYGNKLAQAGKNSKKTWQIINEILNRKKQSESITSIIHDNKEITDQNEISNIFNNYYRDAAISKLTKPIDKDKFKEFLDPQNKQTNTFSLNKITLQETWSHIKSMKPKTSSGIDNIPSV